jgi:hypothetical protein
MSWHLAPSLKGLFAEINRQAPRRNHRSDGSVGDLAHQQRRSDHNPDPFPSGVVRAIDVTHDPRGGLDCNRLARTLQAREDPRIRYVIWNRHIMAGADGPKPWRWRKYHGKNPHTKHLHVSIVHSKAAETDLRVWLGGAPVPLAAGSVIPMKKGWDEVATKDEIKAAVREVVQEELRTVIQGDDKTDDGGAHPHNLCNINRTVTAIKTKVGA